MYQKEKEGKKTSFFAHLNFCSKDFSTLLMLIVVFVISGKKCFFVCVFFSKKFVAADGNDKIERKWYRMVAAKNGFGEPVMGKKK